MSYTSLKVREVELLEVVERLVLGDQSHLVLEVELQLLLIFGLDGGLLFLR